MCHVSIKDTIHVMKTSNLSTRWLPRFAYEWLPSRLWLVTCDCSLKKKALGHAVTCFFNHLPQHCRNLQLFFRGQQILAGISGEFAGKKCSSCGATSSSASALRFNRSRWGLTPARAVKALLVRADVREHAVRKGCKLLLLLPHRVALR